MSLSHLVAGIFSFALTIAGTGAVSGQNYPNKPIRIVTTGVGSGGDLPSRFIAQGLTASLGQPVLVENRASGVIPGEIVSKAPPDGYTLLLYGSTFWIGPLLQIVPYDVVRDFSPISLVASAPNILVVNPALPVKSVHDLIAVAKAKPGELNYASSGSGSTNHLAAELFKAMAGVNLVRIPYKSGSAQMADLIGGQVQLTFSNAGTVLPHIKSGRLRALAITNPQPSVLVPGLPTIAASGVPGYEAVSMLAVFAPAKTPAPIIKRLNQEIVAFLNQPDVKQKFFDTGVDTIGSSPDQLGATIKSEMVRWGKVIKAAGIKADAD
jgi:tripartite-type tricarboxylate transporter receptor subunit TctC